MSEQERATLDQKVNTIFMLLKIGTIIISAIGAMTFFIATMQYELSGLTEKLAEIHKMNLQHQEQIQELSNRIEDLEFALKGRAVR